MSERIPTTPEGYRKMEEDLKFLKSVERPAVIRDIEEARSHGDLSENAEYTYAKEKQFLIEKKMAELERRLSLAEIIDPSKLSGSTVTFGCRVKLLKCDSGEEVSYRIVGEDEANSKEAKISVASPLARSILGKKAGDTVEVVVPAGTRQYEILEVGYD